MTQKDEKTVFISIIGEDQVGFVAQVTARLFDMGLNLSDTTFNLLGTGCEFSCLTHIYQGLTLEDIQQELESLSVLKSAKVEVSIFSHDLKAHHRGTHAITVIGGDQPGFVARLAEVLIEYDANIIHLRAHTSDDSLGAPVYSTNFILDINPDKEVQCIAAVYNTCSQLQLSCKYQSL